MPQAWSLLMTTTMGRLCRTAVSNSLKLSPTEPSPVRTSTCSSGWASLAARPKGRPVRFRGAREHAADHGRGLPELVQPLAAIGEGAPPRLPDEGAQGLTAVRDDPQIDVAPPPHLFPLNINLDHLCLGGDDGLTTTGEHPYPSAQEKYRVRRPDHGRAAACDQEAAQAQRAVLRDGAAGHPIGANRDARDLSELPQLVCAAGEPDAAPGEDDGLLRLRQDGKRLINGF